MQFLLGNRQFTSPAQSGIERVIGISTGKVWASISTSSESPSSTESLVVGNQALKDIINVDFGMSYVYPIPVQPLTL
ncbi:hypothetical protein H0A65_04705 [Alcaligenaceae bacterium]|nr:hypothetical protein [Alcaligenaceae bacterium]